MRVRDIMKMICNMFFMDIKWHREGHIMTDMRNEIKEELTSHILPFWKSLKDEENGGYYGYMDCDLKLDKQAEKGGILNSRILWTFSNAYMFLKESSLLDYAKHAYDFLVEKLYDRERGGIYWSVDYMGNPADTIKHSYNIAFAVYALSSYYDASGDEHALELAKELFYVIENTYRDEFGYKEALTVDFSPQSNEHLSENGVIAEKTMNTTLHIFEAYTELYRVSGFGPAKKSMEWILHIFKDKIFNPEKRRLEVFFDKEFHSILDLHSYGHDIEAAWLIERGLVVLGDKALHEDFLTMFEILEKEILSVAYDGTSVAAECENGVVLDKRIWWVQCEAMIGFYNAYQKRPEETPYLEAVRQIWEFVKTYIIDKRQGGEWINERFYDEERTINREEPMLSPWKCPYHNARMCMEMLKRIPGGYDEIPVNKNATPKAKRLLQEITSQAGKRLITGQHTQTNVMEERAYIKEVTGKYPKLVEFEMLACSPNINYEDASEACLTEVEENKGTLKTALELAKQGDIIPMLCFHWFSPIGGRDKAFYSEHTDFDPERVLLEGTPERESFFHDLDVIAGELEVFRNQDIPVLWRPFHEVEGTWFWWGRKGGAVAKQLYLLMFDYFVKEKGLNNLLWVWSTPTKIAYPGDDYVDIVGWDIYLPEKENTDYSYQYQLLRENTTCNKVAALTEVGYNPDIEMISKTHIPWAFYMTWSKEFAMDGIYNTKEELRTMYDNEYSVTLEA